MPATSSFDMVARNLTGQYHLVREIGRGGMSTVYAARDTKHDREVAIKILAPELGASLGAERFHREIRVVARLQHPHILPLFDSGEIEGLLYFVMPYVEGESLRALLTRRGSLSLDEVTRIVRQLADALDYAHARNVIHRDVKPENVLLTGTQALLADFGVARAGIEGAADNSGALTAAGIAVGTPAYMSPEQALGEDVDPRCDVYALGCLCFEMITGAPPFAGPNAMSLIQQHILAPPPPLTSPHGTLTPAWQAAVGCALAKDRADRYQSAADLASALERALVESRTPSPDEVRLRTAERRSDARPRVLVLDFANIAGASDAGWLSTGIVETLGSDLGRIQGIAVVAQDPATRRRVEAARQDRAVDARLAAEIGGTLGARWVVWGAFQKLGPRIRITSYFLDVETAAIVGGEKVDGAMDDIFTLQDRIVTEIAGLLQIELTSSEVESIERPQTVNIRAYEQYARGYREWLRFGNESTRAAAGHFRAAIAIDPHYAAAYAGLGMIHGPMYIATGQREVLDEATRLLELALSLDPAISEAYAWLAYAQFRQGRFDDSTRTALTGIDRDPRSQMLWYMLGCSYMSRSVGAASPEAIARSVPPLLRCISLGPDMAAYMVLGSVYALRGQASHAAGLLEQAVQTEMAPGPGVAFIGAVLQRAILHVSEGNFDTAAALLDEAIRRYTASDHVYAENLSAYAYVARGWLGERTGELGRARQDHERACEIADANDHRIGIGAHWVKGRFGTARVLQRLGQAEDAERALAEGTALMRDHDRFIWTWFPGGADAEVEYELASTLATLGRTGEALAALRRAADAGWADVAWLRTDPSFALLRDTADVQRICIDAASRVALAPPVGPGGLA